MDDVKEQKIRDLKLRILKVEKELAASQHNTNLGAWLRAGHASQMARQGEKDRKRFETKLEELKAKLAELESADSARPESEKQTAAEKPAAAKKSVKKK
jgi:hypothetical protein